MTVTSNEVSAFDEGLYKGGNYQEASSFEYKLFNNYPNPFNPSTKIVFSLKKDGIARLKIFNVLGKEIKDLVNEYMPAGRHEVEFDANALPSGVYFYVLTSGTFSETKKMILLR